MVLLSTLTACRPDAPRAAAADHADSVLTLQDSVRLQEPDSAMLARPGWFGVAPNGNPFVTERFTARVFEYAPDGPLLRVFGRKGDGPGEFRNPFAIGFIGETAAVFDVGHRRIDRFVGGTYLPPPIPVPLNVTDIAAVGGHLWLGGVSIDNNTSLMELLPRDASLRRRLGLPQAYREMPLLELMGGAVLRPLGDTLALAFGAGDSLYLFDASADTIMHSIGIPRRSRRGFPDGVRRQSARGNGMALLNGASVLSGVTPLAGGATFAVLFEDLTRQRVGFTGQYWLSVVRRDGTPVCIDVPVPLGADDAPRWTFHGDTLVILSQPIRDSTTVETWLRKFVINPTGRCPV